MPAISSVAALIANPSSTFTAAAASTGDSLTVPYFQLPGRAMLFDLIRGGATAGAVRVFSPKLHDTTRGITYYTDKANTVIQMPRATGQPLYPSDTLTVQLTGGTAETDQAVLSMYFDNLPGIAARLARWEDIMNSIVQIKPVVTNPDPDTAGQWATVALNSVESLLVAGADYAVLGFQTDAAVNAVGISGPDTGNLRIACPGDDSTLNIANYFVDLATRHNLPMIPVINANNQGATNIIAIDQTATAEPNVSVILAELAQPFTGSAAA